MFEKFGFAVAVNIVLLGRLADRICNKIYNKIKPKVYSRYWFLPIAVFPPGNNLNCLGIKIGFYEGTIYADINCGGDKGWNDEITGNMGKPKRWHQHNFGHLYVRFFVWRYHSNIRHPFKWRRQ